MEELKCAVANEGGIYRIQVKSTKSYSLRLENAGTPVSVKGASFEMDGGTVVLKADGNSDIVVTY